MWVRSSIMSALSKQEYGSIVFDKYDDVETAHFSTRTFGNIVVDRVKMVKIFSFVALFSLAISLTSNFSNENRSIVYPMGSVIRDHRVKVILFGDSLMDVACKFSLGEKIQNQFPFYLFDIINAGSGGHKISDLLARVHKDVVSKNPDIVLLLWDSDVSDQPVEDLEEYSLQQKYKEDVHELISIIHNTTRHFAVAGPGLLGEGPLFQWNYFQKNRLLDKYREFNRNISENNGVLYIDIRKALRDSLPSMWMWNRWYCTSDGEHPNQRGTQIMAEQFGMALNLFLNVQ